MVAEESAFVEPSVREYRGGRGLLAEEYALVELHEGIHIEEE